MILIVIHVVEALAGGVYTYFKDLSHFMGQDKVAQNIKTYIIYNDKRKEIIAENIQKDFSSNVTLIPLEMERELNPIKDLKATFKLRKLFKEIKPDVIHLHSSKAGVIGRFAKFLTFQKVKVFYTPHGYAFLRQDISESKRKLYRFIEKETQFIFGGTTIACGDTEYDFSKKLGDSVLLRNGIAFEKISSYYLNHTNIKLTIGIVGRITFARNPKLFNDIALKFPQYQFVWIGDGELNEQITASNIRITGWKFNSEEVFSELNNIDVYMQTSLWEGLPIALLEAMSLRKPIVATNIIGNKDVVEHKKTGFLFDDIDELTDYFKQLENLDFRKEMGDQAFIRAQERFDINKNFFELVRIYLNKPSEVVNKNKNSTY